MPKDEIQKITVVETIKEGATVCTVVAASPLGDDAVDLVYKRPDGSLATRLIASADAAALAPASTGGGTPAGSPAAPTSKAFHGSVAVTASVAKSQLVTLADEIITLLASDPTADVRVTLEIAADFPDGASDQIKRAISENATALSFDTALWE